MAAVLYEIEEQEGSDSLTEGSSGSEQAEEEVEEIIEKIPETELLAAGV